MSKKMLLSLVAAGSMVLGGCAAPLASPGPGGIFTEVTEGVQANNGVSISKRGEACAQNILGIVSIGDSTIETAKRNGAIRNVATIDRYYWSILSVYGKACTRVAGN